MKPRYFICSLFFVLFYFPLKAQISFLSLNEIDVVLSISTSENDDSCHVNVVIKNNSTERVYLPSIEKESFEYHFLLNGGKFYSFCGIKQNFLGPLNLGALVRVKELLPDKTLNLNVSIFVKDQDQIRHINEIMHMFDYYPYNKSTRKHIKRINNENVISGIDYWNKCLSVYFSFKNSL